MVNPAVAVSVIMLLSELVSSGFNIYSTNETTSANDRYQNYVNAFYNGAMRENERYWANYIHKHHLDSRQILYPYRTGYNFDASKIYSSDSAMVGNQYNRAGSYVNGGTRVIKSGAFGYGVSMRDRYVPGKKNIDVMYG